MSDTEDREHEGGEDEDLWDPALRRQIRSEQRKIINEVYKNREDITLPDQLLKHLRDLDKLNRNVVACKEAALDSECFRLISDVGRQQAEATHGSLLQFDTDTYAEKLVTFMGGRRGAIRGQEGIGQLDWAKLGERAGEAFHRPPSISFMFGAQETELFKKRKAAAPRKKADKEGAGKATAIKEVRDLREEEESTTKDVQHIMTHVARGCQAHGRLGYFQFLVDPNSFARTVENMFHFSFLIKDGRVGVRLGGDGIPYIYLPSNTNHGQSTKTTKNQVIISLCMEDWERAIAKFKIMEASIPPRTAQQQ